MRQIEAWFIFCWETLLIMIAPQNIMSHITLAIYAHKSFSRLPVTIHSSSCCQRKPDPPDQCLVLSTHLCFTSWLMYMCMYMYVCVYMWCGFDRKTGGWGVGGVVCMVNDGGTGGVKDGGRCLQSNPINWGNCAEQIVKSGGRGWRGVSKGARQTRQSCSDCTSITSGGRLQWSNI